MALKKELNLFMLVLLGIGAIIGAGIYALIGEAYYISGPALWISFLISAFIAGIIALSYAELSSIMPKASAEFEFIKEAFSKRLGIFITLLIIVSGSFIASTVALGFGSYFSYIIALPPALYAIFLLIFTAFILCISTKDSSIIAIIGSFIELFGLIIIIAIALPYFPSYFKSYDFIKSNGFFSIISAAALIFFAYLGFGSISRMAEDSKNAKRNIPKAIILSFLITTIIYILVAIASASVLSKNALKTDAVLALIAEKIFGKYAGLALAIIAIFATMNTVIMVQMANSRLLYGSFKHSWLRKTKKGIPRNAIALISILSILLILINAIDILAFASNFFILIAFVLLLLATIKLRRKYPAKKRIVKLPIFTLYLAIILIIALILSMNLKAIAIGLVFTILLFTISKYFERFI